MPNPHFGVQIITRSQGQSVVAAAAYRSGEILYDERAGKTFDYTRKEDVLHAEIMTPAGAPSWTSDRSALWNRVEADEKRKDARLARNIIAALPRELDKEQNLELVRGYIQDNFTSKGMIADFAIHESDAGDGYKNPHVHILLTLRNLEPGGFGQKNRSWDHKNTLLGWRSSWEEHTNRHLELAGCEERVSLKSFKDQGINKHPTIHLGEDAGNLEKKGVETKRGDYNRKVQHENALIEILEPEYAEIEESSVDNEPERDESEKQRDGLGFLTDNPAMRLEAMTMELKDDQADPSDAVTGSDGEASVNAFKKEDEDPEKLALASLNASRAAHDAALQELLGSSGHLSQREQVTEMARLKEYARRSAEKVKEFTGKLYRQFSNLMRETERLRGRDRDDHER